MSKRVWKCCAAIGLLSILCGALAVLQYRWIGEVADAERARLKENLQDRLNQVRRGFDDQINAACTSFIPAPSEIDRVGREQAYLEQYHRSIGPQGQLIRRVAIASSHEGEVDLLILDPARDRFERVEWPPAWDALRRRLQARLQGGPIPSGQSAGAALVEYARFEGPPGEPGRPREQEWLVLELNTDTIRASILPAVLANNLGSSGRLDYDAEVVLNGDPSVTIYRSGAEGSPFAADATVGLLDIGTLPPPPRDGGRESVLRGRPGFFEDPENLRPPPKGAKGGKKGPPPPLARSPSGGAWLLKVQRRAGSLEGLVTAARRRNIAISAGILVLILATAAVMLRASRQAQRVSELQMNFVAGVSHELRTPLAVIRTAAFNLKNTFASNPEQVERYSELIQKESEKLGALVEQVLRYGSARSGSAIQHREPVEVEALIDSSLRASSVPAAGAELVVEKRIEPGLPRILADEEALKHALQNLFDNAVKHGAEGRWIGIFAAAAREGPAGAIEIRVADRGPGIPRQELAHVFNPFFRGRRAVEDQVHGTGLGLNLVKSIVEAHGGSIRVSSEPLRGTEFVILLPGAGAS